MDRSRLATALATTATAAALGAVSRLGLGSPSLRSWESLRWWLSTRSTATAAMSALLAVAFAVATYLALISLLAVAAEVARMKWLGRLAHRLMPRSLRPLLGLTVGAGLTTAIAASVSPRADLAPSVAVQTVVTTDATATMYAVAHIETSEPAPGAAPTTMAASPADASPPEAAPRAPDAEPQADHMWTIQRGEHLWLVAAETLHDRMGRIPTDREIVPYWKALIELNRDRLVDPDAPDFVYAGQVFLLPPVR